MTINNIDQKIRYFVKIAKYGSLSKAAMDIGISQSGLSRQLAQLESFFQKELFHRTGRGLALTEAGNRLYLETRDSYEKIDAAVLFIRDQQGVTEGKLSIATTYTIGLGFVSELLDTFISEHAGVSLSVTSGASPHVVDLVEKKVVDIGFVYDSAVASDRLQSVPLFNNSMRVVSRPGDVDPDRAVDLSTYDAPLVSYPATYALREMLKSANLEAHIVAEANTLEVILRLVSSGVGQCILPDRIPDNMLKNYGLVKSGPLVPDLSRRVVAIVRRNSATFLARKLFNMAKNISGE